MPRGGFDHPREALEQGWAAPPPVQCSQGGIPYNKWHLDYKDRQIASLREQMRKLRAENAELRQQVGNALDRILE